MSILRFWRPLLASGILAASITIAALPAAVYADSATEVNLLGCSLFEGGATTVPAGEVSLRLPGWELGTRGLIMDFLTSQRTTLEVGTTTVDLTSAWSDPTQLDQLDWVTRPPNYDLGTLAPGESVLVAETITITHPVMFAFPPVGPSGNNGPFLLGGLDGPLASCLITATS
jgi:hypothetical protein